MKLSDLAKWGVPDRIIESWRRRQGESLLPVQAQAVRKGLLGQKTDGGEDSPVRMLISAPTSSGKSFCAEMAMARALSCRRKAVMLVPLKSLAEQKHALFEKTYGSLGVKCLIVTGDHPENDRRFITGDYQVAVAIYEKFDLLLTGALDALKNIGLVVIDEIQTIAEPGRGAVLERLLTKMLASIYRPSLVGLSAVIGDGDSSAGRLASWLQSILVEETARPVDLIRGVAVAGKFYYRSYNSGLDGSEPFADGETAQHPFDTFVRQVKSHTGPTLVFLKSRRETVDSAFRLAAAVSWPEAGRTLKLLDEEEPSFLVRSLRQALTRGVAFHNADLSPRQRAIVERAFMDGEVRVIFATTTLALGVDLPAETVYLETVKYSAGNYDRRPTLVPVTRAEFDNMTGRAGRLRAGNCVPGRAVIMARSDLDRDILWQNYIAPERPEPIRSAFDSLPPEDWLLDMITCGLITDPDSIEQLFDRTFYAAMAQGDQAPDFDSALAHLQHCRLIHRESSNGAVTVTPTGKATALASLSVAQAEYLLRKLSDDPPSTIAGCTALVLSAPGWTLPPGMLTAFELAENMPVRMLYQHFDYLLQDAAVLLGGSRRQEPLTYTAAARLKAWLLLHQWHQLTPVQQLEEHFQLHLGQILALGETAAHLVHGLDVLAATTNHHTSLPDDLSRYVFSLRAGMPAGLERLHARLGRILNRSDFLALHHAGVESITDLQGLPETQLARLIKGEHKLKSLREKLQLISQESTMQTQTTSSQSCLPAAMAMSVRPELIEIDGTFERERYLVKINGFPIRLTGKSFKYFTKLAWSRLNRDSGWMYKEDIEAGFNQARYLYRMKKEIVSALNLAWAVIENNRLGYYRLNADPGAIRVNLDNLRVHPDHEVSSLANRSAN